MQNDDLTNLAERCKEILAWHKSGLLQQDGELRRYADKIRQELGDVFDAGEALLHAEKRTAREAMLFVTEALSAAPTAEPDGFILARVAEELAEGSGAWRSCSGCHELNEGHPTGEWSAILKCHLGLGCRECGGIGAVWDNTDYTAIDQHAEISARCSDCPPAGYPTEGTRCTDCDRRGPFAQSPEGQELAAQVSEMAERVGVKFVPFVEPAARTQGVNVKPLEFWTEPFSPGYHRASSPLCRYMITEYKGMVLPFKLEGTLHHQSEQFETLENAKASAQADYEARILSALQPSAAVPVAWRWRHVDYVSWSYSDARHPREDIVQEPLFASPPSPKEADGLQTNAEPEWVVNDLGELGVKVNGRFFFLYKGESIEYNGSHDDGTPMLYRPVGKREFGETQWPLKWIERGFREERYTEELTFHHGLSFGDPPDYSWRELPPKPQSEAGK